MRCLPDGITILPGDKDIVLSSKDYHNKKKTTEWYHLQETVDLTTRTDRQTASLTKKSDIPEEVVKKLIYHIKNSEAFIQKLNTQQPTGYRHPTELWHSLVIHQGPTKGHT